MSLIDQFFEKYDNLMARHGGVGRFWQRISKKKVSQYINQSRRNGRMPPPTSLKYFEGYLDSQFILKCMQYYSDTYPECMTLKMDAALDEFTFKYRQRGRRKERKLSSQLHLERAWALGA